LDITPPKIRVRDFGSKNGTYVNGEKIGQREIDQSASPANPMKNPEYHLKDKDELKLGQTIFRVTIELGSQESPSRRKQSKNLSTIINRLITEAGAGRRDLQLLKDLKILKSLGSGAFGEAFLILNQQTGQLLALKVMQPEVVPSKDNREMFLQEIGKTKTLNHPNIIKILDYGYGNGIFFLMMEYCEGGTVADLMREIEGCLSGSEAIPIILQTLTGIDPRLAVLRNETVPICLRDGSIPKNLASVIDSALIDNPQINFPTSANFKEALIKVL